MSLQYYELDPCNVFTTAGLAWNAMLKMTGVRLESVSYTHLDVYKRQLYYDYF